MCDPVTTLDECIAIINSSIAKACANGEPFEAPTVLFFGPFGTFRLKPREDDPRLVMLDGEVGDDSTPPAT